MAKKYEELTFTDDFMFCKVLSQDPQLCRELLSLILDREVGKLASINPQKPIEITADGRGVRFDIYAEDDDKTIYNVEMQNAPSDHLAKRTRYSQGMIDLNLLNRGAKYRDLNRSYVIFICQFNINKEAGLHRYRFANLCREKPTIELGDEAEKIFLCADGTADDVSEKLKVFLNYIAGRRPADEFTQVLENAVKSAREHIQWRQEYMTFLEIIEQEKEKAIIEERARTEQERKRADEEKKRADRLEAELEQLRRKLAEKLPDVHD